MRRRLKRSSPFDAEIGFQIAPMIDVVFVIMLFFMVMAGAVKVEKEINTQLPGTADTAAPTDFVDEVVINISQEGQVTLNDEPMDDLKSKDMPQLRATLARAKQSSDAAKSELMVTIVSDSESRYSRAVDVLDILAATQIHNVSFTTSDEDDQ
jgi:biopolymer transport protein ExbD